MCHRYRTASSGKNTGNLYRRNNRHNTGRKCRRCHHRLWYCNQSEETGSDRSNERCRPSVKTIEELRDIAYSIAGEPQKVQFGDRVVGVIESRDGTIMDVVRQIKPFEFDD